MSGVLAPTSTEMALQKMDAFVTKMQEKEELEKTEKYGRANGMSVHNGGSSHHIGDYLPNEELDKFKRASVDGLQYGHQPHHGQNSGLQGQNRGHALLRKLGWNEGQGLGRNAQGMQIPVAERMRKRETNAGVGGRDGARKPWDPEQGDDQFDLYKKKMMLSYRYRPNPLGNPRKDYY